MWILIQIYLGFLLGTQTRPLAHIFQLSHTHTHSLLVSLSITHALCQLPFCLPDILLKMFVMRRRFNTINMLTVLLAAYSYNKGATATPHTHTHMHTLLGNRRKVAALPTPTLQMQPRPGNKKNVRMRRCQQKYQNKKILYSQRASQRERKRCDQVRGAAAATANDDVDDDDDCDCESERHIKERALRSRQPV